LLRNVVYVLLRVPWPKTTQVGTLYTWNVVYYIVCSKVLQALSIILTNQYDMSKQVQ